ncbi:AI-2E family transporter [Actinoplanes teichomyceticus]|uniref:Putative PurR-regulated permease PerM n=1 Tax=Actinoplanes teichomyceticus TaxID=1867 RepID=A0A561WJW3_ACTTI|nr:AI-2E family transporter [Actinoplanes teichomyceticus]TWG24169.1 putative PurR-regulated permease PerM [Actinoplanes teichomyceticus]
MGPKLSTAKTRTAMRDAARVSAQTLLILLLTYVVLRLLGMAWSVIWPLVVALLLTTLTWPPARFLRRHGWPPALAASLVTVLFLSLVAGIVVLIAAPVAGESGKLADGVAAGIQQVRDWASGPPLNIGDDQVSSALDQGMNKLQHSVGSIASATLSGVSTVINGLVTTILALFLMFFFLKDGPRFLPWLARQLPGRLSADVPEIADRAWSTLGSFVRSQAFVGLLDAIFIGVGLWITGVPLVLPLAVLTFVTAFVPIVGAVFAGLVAVLIALVFTGWVKALIVLGIILLVQQLEGNVFQPMIQSRGLGLHAGVVLLAVTLGGNLAGIVGSLLAVPVAGLIAVVWNYLREQLSEPVADPAGEKPPAETPATAAAATASRPRPTST